MAFLDLENSSHDGKPIALYEFRRGGIARYYASCDHDIIANGVLWVATPISDEGIVQKGTAVTDGFEMTMPIGLDVPQWYLNTPPSDTVYIVVRRFHGGDTQAVIIWLGEVVTVAYQNEDVAKVTAQAVSISLRRSGLRLSWQRGCPHALYDQNCQVDKTQYQVKGVVTAVDPTGVTIDQLGFANDPNKYWPGGFIEFELEPGVIEKRLIEQVQGGYSGTIYPFGYTDGILVGMEMTVYPGCKRTSAWCANAFRNIENYGGFPWMPTRSPFDGDPVF